MVPSAYPARFVRAGQGVGVPKQPTFIRENPANWRLPVLAAGQGLVCWRTLTRNDTVILDDFFEMRLPCL